MVAGSLLGIDVNGVVDITYSYPYPQPGKNDGDDDVDDESYQMDMMKMLGQMNVDNNVVGWYQSMYYGTMCTNEVIESQQMYQTSEDLAGNSVVIMYDPTQTRKGGLCIRAYRLSDKFLAMRRAKNSRDFIKPSDIFDELPVSIKTSGHTSAFTRCIQDTHNDELQDCNFEALSLVGSDNNTEKHLELVSNWIDDLVQEQYRLQQYAKSSGKQRQDHVRWYNKRKQENNERRENGESLLSMRFDEPGTGLKPIPAVPERVEGLLAIEQLDRYCNQINDNVDTSFTKLLVAAQLNA